MGTHPIFESDFDCLTECCASHREPCRPPFNAEWTLSRPSLSTRSVIMQAAPQLKESLMAVLLSSKRVLTSKSVWRVLTAAATWTNSPKSTSPPQISPKTQLTANEQSTLKSTHNYNSLAPSIYCRHYV